MVFCRRACTYRKRGASKEYAQSLLRIDAKPRARKVGKFADVEKALFSSFRERRARGRKVSGRWLSRTFRALMRSFHPGVAYGSSGGRDWRRRFSLRFNIGVKRKTNVKNKTWADTEPVLLRYFTGLRKRLQLQDTSGGDDADEPTDSVEPEPEDLNPDFEVEEQENQEAPLDSSDDEEVGDTPCSFADAMPANFVQAALPPTQEMLQFSPQASTAADELVDRWILYMWPAVGWCAGRISARNSNYRITKKLDGVMEKVNFLIYYSLDESTVKTVLRLAEYGDIAAGAWVLLEPLEVAHEEVAQEEVAQDV